MAAETEGIALLSMYGDEEEEEEAPTAGPAEEGSDDGEGVSKVSHNKSDYPLLPVQDTSPLPVTSASPRLPVDGIDWKALRSPFPHRTPTPQWPSSRSQLSSPFTLTSPSPPPPPVPQPYVVENLLGQKARRNALAIVDYAQDETAMSPEAEGMEIEGDGRTVFGTYTHDYNVNIEGTTLLTSQMLTPSRGLDPLQPFDIEQVKDVASLAVSLTEIEVETVELMASSTFSSYKQMDTLLQNFLPPPVTTDCPQELQEKINRFLAYKKAGKSFNADLRNRKDYRNPNFLQHAVSYQDIDEVGTCFSKEVFDPHGYHKSDYYDEIEADMKRELEKKEQERKKTQKLDLASTCTQPAAVTPALKMNAPLPALLSSALQPSSTNVDAARDSRINKKSKWDKVDGDAKNPLPSGGHDNLPNVSVQAAHLSAASAGTGYSAFAEQKRREAEERRTGEKRFDKRS
ncbi:hypothetical protein HPP92_021480 [Vanilla planifolia]|uniref:SAP30-binding protein n=1 Tax=Vanilla planifolia TaxID=51239 RepID=A0A835UH52_VANPL|nr:hypothetical protein HPP92_021480 [Vanilla planifolia]